MAPVGFHFSLPAAEGGIPYTPAVVTQPACPTPRAKDEPSAPEACWLPLMDGPFDSPPSAILDEASEQASKERAKGERKAAKEEKKGEQRAAKAEAKQLKAQEKAAKKEEKRVAREMADTAKTVKSLQKEQDRLAKRAGVAENKGEKASKQRRALE